MGSLRGCASCTARSATKPNAAQPAGRRKTRAVGQALETDTAAAVARAMNDVRKPSWRSRPGPPWQRAIPPVRRLLARLLAIEGSEARARQVIQIGLALDAEKVSDGSVSVQRGHHPEKGPGYWATRVKPGVAGTEGDFVFARLMHARKTITALAALIAFAWRHTTTIAALAGLAGVLAAPTRAKFVSYYDLDLAKTCKRAAVHPAQVVGDLHQRHGDGAQLARELDGRIL